MKLEEIKKKLEELNIEVCYGVAERKTEALKEYIVFGRDKIKVNDSKMSTTDCYEVAVVMENWIAEGFIDDIIDKLKQIGLKRTGDDIEFNYLVRNDISFEIASIKFYDTVGRSRWL